MVFLFIPYFGTMVYCWHHSMILQQQHTNKLYFYAIYKHNSLTIMFLQILKHKIDLIKKQAREFNLWPFLITSLVVITSLYSWSETSVCQVSQSWCPVQCLSAVFQVMGCLMTHVMGIEHNPNPTPKPITKPVKTHGVATGMEFGHHTCTCQTCGPYTTGLPVPVPHPTQNSPTS